MLIRATPRKQRSGPKVTPSSAVSSPRAALQGVWAGTLRERINKALTLAFSLWVVWPLLGYQVGMYGGMALALAWLLTTGDFLQSKNFPPVMLWTLIYGATLLPYVLTGTLTYGALNPFSTLGAQFLFLVGALMLAYHLEMRRDYAFLRAAFLVGVAGYVVGSIQTALGLFVFPGASRLLAAERALTDVYEGAGIGGFGFVYGASLVCLMLVFILRASGVRTRDRLAALGCLIVISYMLVAASYTLALLALGVGALVLLLARSRATIVVLPASALMCLILFRDSIGQFLMALVGQLPGDWVVREKLFDLARSLVDPSFSGLTAMRYELYFKSADSFLRHPFFGIYGSFNPDVQAGAGNHSGWLDLLAYFGLVGALPLFLAVIANFATGARFYRQAPFGAALLAMQVIFVLYGLLNPITYIYQLGFTMFFLAPLAGLWVCPAKPSEDLPCPAGAP